MLGLWLLSWCPLLATVCVVCLSVILPFSGICFLAFPLPLDASDIFQLLLLIWCHRLGCREVSVTSLRVEAVEALAKSTDNDHLHLREILEDELSIRPGPLVVVLLI